MTLYVYAITNDSHPLRLDDLKGVGDSPSELRVVRGDSLCAVVSDAPEDLSLARRNLEAHHTVQERLWSDGVTLPLGFGFVAQDEEAVRTVLEQGAEQYAQRLAELAGRVEFNVKGVQDEDTLLRQIVEESDRIRELNEATREGRGSPEQRIALGQLVAQEVQARQDALAERVVTTLRPLGDAENVSPPSQQYFVNASFLMADEKSQEFTDACARLSEQLPEGAELRLGGPLPPYSFA
ncbi:GvpL/GvpF family gas vesicle protein [Streptomyces chromofuscus]|uniref:GvpL/GvpF family gas vesicle protein n=1 Tax=Streptomyces chromofuscus TaxID=42881 RepID=A0A7M2TD26_STRCW|nr:GvpL/GvpF family gas vesicle protein [Streptomyces chromofuscus]QOV46637.1 GvpL/GvpF family gas vesicle protein [Streptomyces chromofuscus]GGT08411.1 gas vesicle protein [Streptomyces chromofuscus]